MIYLNILFIAVFIGIHFLNLYLPIRGKNNILFSCNLEQNLKDEEPFRGIIKSYKIKINIIFAVTFIVFLGAMLKGILVNGSLIILYVILAGIVIALANKRVKEEKKELKSDHKREVCIVDMDNGKLGSTKIMYYVVLSVVAIGYNLWMIIENYNSLPNKIATHFSMNGTADGWMTKSPGTISLNMIFVIFTLIIYIVADILVIKTKYKVDPRNPEGSIQGNRKNRRLMSLMIGVTMIPVIFIDTITNLTIIEVLPTSWISKSMLLIILVVIGSMGIAIVGVKSRNNYNVVRDDVKEKDDDNYWKLGLIYYNKNDHRTFVEKRTGVGVTVNAGSTGGMIFYIVTLLLLVVAIVAPIIGAVL